MNYLSQRLTDYGTECTNDKLFEKLNEIKAKYDECLNTIKTSRTYDKDNVND